MISENETTLRPEPLSDEERFLVEAYRHLDTPLDQLPYTQSFEKLAEHFADHFKRPLNRELRREILTTLLKLRKRARLPRHREGAIKETDAPHF